MTADFIRERITQLRLRKDVSEHRMSLDLGHARSYIHGIVCGRTLPSMAEFIAICDYFDITPEYFFKQETNDNVLLSKLNEYAEQLSDKDLALIVELAERLSEKQAARNEEASTWRTPQHSGKSDEARHRRNSSYSGE